MTARAARARAASSAAETPGRRHVINCPFGRTRGPHPPCGELAARGAGRSVQNAEAQPGASGR